MLKKLCSRKFQVWIAWLGIVITSFIITKTINPEIITWFGFVSIIYVGGNVAQKFLEKK